MPSNKLKALPLEWIRVFEAAGRTGNFTAAAHECGLTQAAVSQRIRNLEDRIGTKLFVRQARGVRLTVDGEAWLPYATNAFGTLQRSADELFGAPLKKLVISASTSITQLWLTPRLAQLSQTASYQISITTVNVEADFAASNSTVEIRYGLGGWSDVACQKLYSEVLTPMAAPSLQATNQNWRALPLIAVSGPRQGWEEWAAQTEDTPLPIPQFRFDTFASALAAAKAGAGVILASEPLCKPELAAGNLVRLSQKALTPDASYWLVRNGRLADKQWQQLTASLCVS